MNTTYGNPPLSARPAPSPRLLQPYSPRRPSPLGFPPLAPHMAFQSPSYPVTPERPIYSKGPPETRVALPAEARRPLAGTTQRPRSQPPAPLNLNTRSITQPQNSQQPATTQGMTTRPAGPPSPTPSDASSVSLYSAESVSKNFPVDVRQGKQQQQEEEERPSNPFCACLNLRALFGSKSKESRILGPPQQPQPQQPAPAPPMTQVPRRRPSPLNL
ncbi:unnamed protein product [Cyclocybe aegerita]|uniref:Uncharacterized protein n=1 Tax=Cyclocybe aegerita TaxID=1973307 RepID=A0A8S0XLS5_CYCAE|nr:unnamed protein product [Cyclocybe aegerita]